MPARKRTVEEWIWLTVVTTNGGNKDERVPADTREWSVFEARRVARLQTFAERVGTYVQRTTYRLL